jgi:hypothetical protein
VNGARLLGVLNSLSDVVTVVCKRLRELCYVFSKNSDLMDFLIQLQCACYYMFSLPLAV